jgi:hypothetical protein
MPPPLDFLLSFAASHVLVLLLAFLLSMILAESPRVRRAKDRITGTSSGQRDA